MNQNIKFKYEDKYIIFYIQWRGAYVEVLKAIRPNEGANILPTIKRLRSEAQFQANELMGLLKLSSKQAA